MKKTDEIFIRFKKLTDLILDDPEAFHGVALLASVDEGTHCLCVGTEEMVLGLSHVLEDSITNALDDDTAIDMLTEDLDINGQLPN